MYFFVYLIKKAHNINMIKYDEEVIKVLKECEKIAIKLNNNYISTEHLILSTLKIKNRINEILKSFNISYEDCLKEIKKEKKIKNWVNLTYTPLFKRILTSSIKNNKITLKNIYISFLEEGEGLGITLLNDLNVDILKLYKKIKEEKNLNLGRNLNQENIEPIIGREKEIKEIIQILCQKNKNNPLLIGEAGVGKTAIIESLAQNIKNKKVPKELLNKEIIEINMASIIAGTKYRGEFEEKLDKIINEFENSENLIMFIDEVHTIVGAGGAEGAIDASNILKPYLARNKIKCIGATTLNEYSKYIMNDKALNRRFKPVLIKEPTKEETINILLNTKKYYEKFHSVKITKKQIIKIVELAQNIKNKKEPDRSLDLLDKICTETKLKNKINNNYIDLLKEKNEYIKNNQYKKAIEINNKIKKEKKNLIINNQEILKTLLTNNRNSIGYKI